MKNKLVLPVMMACTSGLLPAYAHAASSSVVIANYRFPDSLYALLEQGIKIPVYLVNTRPHSAQQGNHEGTASEYVRIGDVTLFAKDLKLGLEKQGILVRHYSKPGLQNCIRISVGRPEQTDRLVEALRAL